MKQLQKWKWLPMVILGCAVFSLGFDLFLAPQDINCGGLSGLAQILVRLTGIGTIGVWTAAMNIPLFLLGGKKIGRQFFIGSLVGMLSMSLFLDLFTAIPAPKMEPMLGTLYGGLVSGVGMGLVFLSGVSSGGTDILVRLLKLRAKNVPIGKISLCLDVIVVTLTGIVFRDFSKALYSGVTLFVSSMLIDAVVYRFDYSKVALIVTGEYERIAAAIDQKLGRGVTLLYGQGYYSRQDTKVILTAVKRQQLSDLKELVVGIDPNAFIILQEAHQVLGDGFSRYSKNAL